MSKYHMAYGRSGLDIEIDDSLCQRLLIPVPLPPSELSDDQQVLQSLANPTGSEKLSDLAAGKEKVCVISSDHTRPVPSRYIMKHILAEIRKGSPSADISILIATGCHRPTTKDELIEKFGPGIVEREKIVIHDAYDEKSLVHLGPLSSGNELYLNRVAAEADLCIAEGFVEPHFFAGFSGGRKSILPGVAGAETILFNHCAEFVGNGHSVCGRLEENPVHQDMLEAATKARLAFIVNVVIDAQRRILASFAGHPQYAHEKACEFVLEHAHIKVPASDIVISTNGGYPMDQNIYQAVKGMRCAAAVCRENGTIIMLSACADGHGGEGFFNDVSGAVSPQELLDSINATDKCRTRFDQWQTQVFADILSRFKVIFVSGLEREMIEAMHMTYAPDFKSAFKMALAEHGSEAEINVIPDGIAVIAGKCE